MQTFYVFDLDGTCIDSSHRYRNKPCGSIDLQYWFDNITPEQVAKDKLLPTAQKLIRYKMEGRNVMICTARAMEGCDFDYLQRHGLYVDEILHRPSRDCLVSDAEMKAEMIEIHLGLHYGESLETCRVVMFEDNWSVIHKLRELGIICVYVGNDV